MIFSLPEKKEEKVDNKTDGKFFDGFVMFNC